MLGLLEDFAATFNLNYRIGGTTLEERISETLETIDTSTSPAWGRPGPEKDVLSRESRSLKFYYLPHLFPEMDRKLRLAHKLQFSLLPTELPEDSFISISAVLESYCHLSGDLFGWECLKDGDFFIWIFDVSGHGVRSGTASTVLKLLILSEPERENPAALVANLNESLCNCLRSHVSSFFATGIFLRIAQDGSAVYSSAGHQPFLIHRQDGRIESFEPTGMPVGMLREARWDSVALRLARRDTFLLFTDGLTELANDFEEEFGLKRVEVFLRSDFETPWALTDALYRAVGDYSNLDLLSDDVTFVAGRRVSG